MGKLAEISSDPNESIPELLRQVLSEVLDQYLRLKDQLVSIERQLNTIANESSIGQRLQSIPGVGVITACYIISWVGDGTQFKNGRELAAWIGLVPRQYSTGGKNTLLGISKRGNGGLRRCLIHGARSAIQWKLKEGHEWSGWIINLLSKKPKTVAVVAMANKMARIIWAVLVKNGNYKANMT